MNISFLNKNPACCREWCCWKDSNALQTVGYYDQVGIFAECGSGKVVATFWTMDHCSYRPYLISQMFEVNAGKPLDWDSSTLPLWDIKLEIEVKDWHENEHRGLVGHTWDFSLRVWLVERRVDWDITEKNREFLKLQNTLLPAKHISQ